VGTAHGNTLENLILNPTLSDLVGGVQSVTLGDEEARHRGTQKSILERKAPPTFDVVVEIQDFYRVAVHADVSEAVDVFLRGQSVAREVRWTDEDGALLKKEEKVIPFATSGEPLPKRKEARGDVAVPRIYIFGINRAKLEQAARERQSEIRIVSGLREATVFVTCKAYYRRKPQIVRDAELAGIPVYVLKNNTIGEMRQFLDSLYSNRRRTDDVGVALKETEEAIAQVVNGTESIQLSPRSSYVRRLQHLMAERSNLASRSTGRDPQRRVEIFRVI
jgi:DNA-binding NarL/FixJ family response regulator